VWPNRADERRHPTNPDPWGAERWCFEVAQPGGPALFVEYTLLVKQRLAWFVAGVTRTGEPVVLCRDPEVPLPSTSVLEIRSGALWSHAICEEPLDRWTVAMEAFALEIENPYDAWTNEIGNRLGVACDLEWEASGLPTVVDRDHSQGYSIEAVVYGDLQVGEERWDLDTRGRWVHQWGIVTDSWFNEMRCSQIAADNVTVCWAVDGPHGSVHAVRHVLPQGWCNGTE
jgi:hypothetical protein